MGCCLSTPATANKATHRRLDDSKSRIKPTHPTPSPPFEKESVKEVLSETPTPISMPIFQNTTQILHENDAGKKSIQEKDQEIVTETSEMCSYSESFYVATTATLSLTENKREVVEIEDDGEEVTQKIITSPPPKMVRRKRPEKFSGEIFKEEDGGISPPARRLVTPSPKKKSRFPAKTMQTAERHGNARPPDIVRRGLPAKRSRSPAIRGQRLNMREESIQTARNSGEEIRVKSGDNERKVKVVKVGAPSEPETRESLDNPVVSLECFIFL